MGYGERPHIQSGLDERPYERDNETGLDYAQARYYSSKQGRFTSVDPYDINMERQYQSDYEKANELLYRYITKPLRWNRYAYALNNPLRYVDPSGEGDEDIVVRVNIVYDKKTVKTEAAARKLTAAAVADATQTYATAGIKLEVTYTAGTANTTDASDSNQQITSGKMDGALNVFISNDFGNQTIGRSDTSSGESFINYGRGESEPGLLAHELGHQFGIATSSNLPSALGWVFNQAYNLMDDDEINGANDLLRRGETQRYVYPTNMMAGLDNSGARGHYTRISEGWLSGGSGRFSASRI